MSNTKIKFTPTQRPAFTRLSIGQKYLHLWLLIIGWGLFIYFSWRFYADYWGMPPAVHLLKMIGVVTILICCATIIWINYNLCLLKKPVLRDEHPVAHRHYTTDWDGKNIIADWQDLKKAPLISVQVMGNTKSYLVIKNLEITRHDG